MNDRLSLAQYAIFVILVLAAVVLMNKCLPMSEASDRARSGGSEARVVEEWPWE